MILLDFLGLDNSNWIAIIDILVTSIIGIWIGRSFQVNLTTTRALKEHFIDEIRVINTEYAAFFNLLYKENTNAKAIIEWLKVMNIKIEQIETSIRNEFRLEPKLLDEHIKLKVFITKTDELNSEFGTDSIKFKVETWNDLLDMHKKLKQVILNLIVDLNKGKRLVYKPNPDKLNPAIPPPK